MKKLPLLAGLVSLTFGSLVLADENYISFGVGAGAMYSGLGANISYVSDRDLKYLSLGCVEYSSEYGASCGLGAGWIKTDLFGSQSNKHGIGLYAGIAGGENIVAIKNNRYDVSKENIYGIGVGYTYFMNGINKPGLTLGATLVATNAESSSKKAMALLQVGYQF